MKTVLSILSISLLFALVANASAQQPDEPSLPGMKVASAWLEQVDKGALEAAWNSADAALRAKTDLVRWSADVAKKRGSSAGVKCRRGVDFELYSDPEHVEAIFVTQFNDGRVIGERVSLVDDDNEVSHIIGYRVTPSPKKSEPACSD